MDASVSESDAIILTGVFVAILLGAIGVKVWLANRRAAAERLAAEERARERAAKEKELLERLGRLKRDDLAKARDAIRDDPERAARIVGKMMREKDGG